MNGQCKIRKLMEKNDERKKMILHGLMVGPVCLTDLHKGGMHK
jgi:hypothetical protein